MPFGLNLNSGGDYLEIVKYDARSGRVTRIDRDADSGERAAVDITDGFECLPDLEHAGKGWAWFQSGQQSTLDFVMRWFDAEITFVAAAFGKPSPGSALRLTLSPKSGRWHGAEPRELTVTASAAFNGLWALYTQGLAQREHYPGKTPVAKLTGVKPVTSGSGARKSTNYEPQFAIVKWVKSPQDFEMPPERTGATPNGSAAADAYKAAKDGSPPRVAPAQIPPPPPPPADEESDWG